VGENPDSSSSPDPTLLRPLLLAALSLAAAPAFALDPTPFDGKPLVAPGVHVDNAAQWHGQAPMLLHAPDERDANERLRIGTVTFAPGIDLDLESEDNQVNFPFFVELRRTKSQDAQHRLLLRVPVRHLANTHWYFPGNGFAYLYTLQWQLCGPHTTRKFALSGGALVEVPQPLLSIDTPTEAETATPLYDAPDGKKVVATVTKGTRVQVVAMQFARFDDTDAGTPLLVRTPLGLVGWHRRDAGQNDTDGTLSIYQCN
jgi:hypothetical protein